MHFPGDHHYRASNATWPLAELRVAADTAEIRLRWRLFRILLGHWLPTIELEPAGVGRIESLRLWPGGGFRFWPSSGKPVIFWCLSPDQGRIADALEDCGFEVSREAHSPW